MKVPNNLNGYFLFLKPFTNEIWAAFFLTWIFFACVLFFISYLNKKVDAFSGNVGNEQDFSSLIQCVRHFSFGTLYFGVERFPPMLTGKVLQCFWSMLMLILVSLYTANLAAILSTHFEEKPLQTIDDIVQS